MVSGRLILFIACVVLYFVTGDGWCGCVGDSGCTKCCGFSDKNHTYDIVWEHYFHHDEDLHQLFHIETKDKSGDFGSHYVDDGTTVYVNKHDQLTLNLVELDPYTSGPMYKSGRLRTWDSWTYGLFVVKTSNVPRGCGLWPAIRLSAKGGESKFGPWPKSGEIDILEAINFANFSAGTINYGSCERGQSEKQSYCRHRSKNIWDASGTAPNSTYVLEWDEEYIRFFHWTDGKRPKGWDSDHPDPDSWENQGFSMGTFWHAGVSRGNKPEIPIPPYNNSYIDGVAGFLCPTIKKGDDPSHYDHRCHKGDEYCPGMDYFQGVQGGSGCDFDAPFGKAICDEPGFVLTMNLKVCGNWPITVPPGTVCCIPDSSGAYPSSLSGYGGQKLIIDSIRIFQKHKPPERNICCPIPETSEDLLINAMNWICDKDGGALECSPIYKGGVYHSPNTILDHAKWVFNQYYQRRGSHAQDCSNANVSAIISGYSTCP